MSNRRKKTSKVRFVEPGGIAASSGIRQLPFVNHAGTSSLPFGAQANTGVLEVTQGK